MGIPAWHKYQDRLSIKSKSAISKSIIEEIASIPLSLRQKNESEELTNQIKFQLVKLGYQEGYCVYTCLKKSKSRPPKKKSIDQKRILLLREIKNIVAEAKNKHEFGDHKFSNREWLFDIHWYRDYDHYCPQDLTLVAESELGNRRIEDISKQSYSSVKYDFQKLLVANAKLRLLIFRVSDLDYLYNSDSGLAAYFVKSIEAYDCLTVGSKFLFICFFKNEVLFRELKKKQNASI